MTSRPSFVQRVASLSGIGATALIVAFIAIRLFAPAWWAVPGLLLNSVGQQVPRETGSISASGSGALAARPTAPSEGTAPAGAATGAAAARPVGAPAPETRPEPSPHGAVGQGPASTPAPTRQSGPVQPTSSLIGSLTGGVLLPSRRFTVLLLGSDNDNKFTADSVLTQSMILVSVDPATRQVAMVSIPRDSWVPIPTYGDQKIDVAYEVGGIALARRTVEELYGIHVDYYAWVGLNGLVNVIDSLGGVNITVLHPILDETYPDDLTGPNPYAFFRLYIPAGPQHLDGTTALQYVRSRHGDLQSDFGRSARQQQVLLALKDLATDPAMISHIPGLAETLNGSVKTDLSLPQIAQLANLARGIPSSQIHQQVLAAPQFAELGWSPDHQEQIVIPDWRAIRTEMAQLLHLHPDNVSEALADQARQEDATIRVLNGTGEAYLAHQVKDFLAWQGLSVVSTGNAARSDYAHSQIVVRDLGNRSTVQVLAVGLNASVVARPDPTLPTDITVIVGDDHPAVPTLLGGSDAAIVPEPLASPTPLEAARPLPTPRPAANPSPVPDRAGQVVGQVVVPNLIGMPEAAAQRAISESGLMTTYVNYQTANDVADHAYFRSIPRGGVLSQQPPPGTSVPRGTKVLLAVRKP